MIHFNFFFHFSKSYILFYRGGKDFKKAMRFIKLVSKKMKCKTRICLYTKEFLDSPVGMSHQERIEKGWMLQYPFSIKKDDDESIIVVVLDGGNATRSAFEIAPGDYCVLTRNKANRKLFTLNDRLRHLPSGDKL